MAKGDHSFCTVHRIAYNRRVDPICPQCTLARMQPAEQLDYDVVEQAPVKSGKLLDAFTLQPRG